MIKNLKKLVPVVMSLASLCLAGYPSVYWFYNPELSSMQVFQIFWQNFLVGIPLALFLLSISDSCAQKGSNK